MIVRNTVQMPCPHCQHVQDFEVLLLVTGDMEPPLRDRIISGDWATFSCQQCQKQERILYPTLYEDRVRKVRIHYQPDEAEAAQLLKQLPETVVKKVLSTIINKLCFFANFEISTTSHSSINGFDGVSIKIAFVFAVIAASISAKEEVFT